MAAVGLGVGFGVLGLMKWEVAGRVPLWMSGVWRIREERGDTVGGGILADCSHCFCHCGGNCLSAGVNVGESGEMRVGGKNN